MKITLTTLSTISNVESRNLLRMVGFSLAFAILSLATFQPTLGQDDEEEPYVVRVYDVSEFVTTTEDHSFQGYAIPGLATGQGNTYIGGSGNIGGGGFGGAGGGGGGGGGVFRVAPASPQGQGGGGGGFGGGGISGFGQFFGGSAQPTRSSVSMQDVYQAIVYSVAVDSWEENGGGMGVVTILGDVLVISQTPTIHDQVDAFLKMLGQTSVSKQNRGSVTISAIWLNIDEGQLDALDVQSDRSVDRAALKKLTEQFGKRGQITCFDGQLVHIASGNLRSSIESVVPIVGQNKLPGGEDRLATSQPKSNPAKPSAKLPTTIMAQVSSQEPTELGGGSDGDSGPNQIGYQPVSRWTNYGALLQVRPKVERDRQILLDLTSVVTEPGAPYKNMSVGVNEIETHNMHCQQFNTSVRLNDSTPTLVGGSAFDVANGGNKQTYLIIEATKVVKPSK